MCCPCGCRAAGQNRPSFQLAPVFIPRWCAARAGHSPAFPVLSLRCHAACSTRARRSGKPARPYMVRFSILSFLRPGWWSTAGEGGLHGGEGGTRGAHRPCPQPQWWGLDARPPSASPGPRRGWGNCAYTPGPCNTAAQVGQISSDSPSVNRLRTIQPGLHDRYERGLHRHLRFSPARTLCRPCHRVPLSRRCPYKPPHFGQACRHLHIPAYHRPHSRAGHPRGASSRIRLRCRTLARSHPARQLCPVGARRRRLSHLDECRQVSHLRRDSFACSAGGCTPAHAGRRSRGSFLGRLRTAACGAVPRSVP